MYHSRHAAFVLVALFTSAVHAQEGWPLFRGNLQRTGAASKNADWDKRPAWQRPLMMDTHDPKFDPDPEDAVKKLIDKQRGAADPHLLPSSFPLIAGDMAIYRSYRDVRTVAVQSMKPKNDEFKNEPFFKPGEIVWKSIEHDTAIATLLEKPRAASVNVLLASLQPNKQDHWVWANPMVGALSTDGKSVFAVSSLVFPPIDPKNPGPLPGAVALGALAPLANESGLIAYDLQTGKQTWDTNTRRVRASPFEKTHFLGAPLPAVGKLYVLNEKDGDLRLLTIHPDQNKWANPSLPDVEKTLTIAKIPEAEQIVKSPLRRTQPLHLAQQEGLLVCPTHAGVLVGVDRAKMAVLWTYRYRDGKIAPPALPPWQAACPIIHQNRIVFTAADSKEIHCLDIDGTKKWTAVDANGLYVAAVHDDLVFVVGKGTCRALKLADGTEKWKLEMGAPAGVGVQAGALYYLPLKKDAINDAPTIWAIDLAKGVRTRRVNVPHPEALGNLALHRGLLVSQSFTHIAAFPLPLK